MKRRTVSIVVAVLAVGIIGVFTVSRMQTKADTVPIMSDSVEIAQDDVTEELEQETEQPTPITEVEPEQTKKVAPTTQEQDNAEQDEIDVVAEEPDTAPIDEALTDITALDKTMYATSEVNTRSGPSTEYERVGGLTTNEAVKVTGQSNLTSWYRIDIDGVTQFVSNKYLSDSMITVTQESSNNGGGSSNNGSGGSSSNSGGSGMDSVGPTGKSWNDILNELGGGSGPITDSGQDLSGVDWEHGGSEGTIR